MLTQVDNPNIIWQFMTFLGGLESVGSIIAGWQAFWNSRENLKFFRDQNKFDPFNQFYGPLFFETPDFCYIYLTFCVMNERKKILIKEINSSIFNLGDQKWMPCEILKKPPSGRYRMGEAVPGSAGHFPEGYNFIGLLNQREIPEKSARDYFLGLRCPGFAINNVEGIEIETPQDPFSAQQEFDLKIEFLTSSGKNHMFQTKVWLVDPKTIDPKGRVQI